MEQQLSTREAKIIVPRRKTRIQHAERVSVPKTSNHHSSAAAFTSITMAFSYNIETAAHTSAISPLICESAASNLSLRLSKLAEEHNISLCGI